MKKRFAHLALMFSLLFAAAVFAAENDAPAASRWAGLAGFFVAYLTGLALSFTPCVWPMYPITSSVIIGSAAVKTKKTAFFLSIAYVLGLALAYTILGAITGKLGEVAANYLKSVWIVGAMAVILIVFGLSMLGLFEINLPASFISRFMKPNRKGYAGVFIMGIIAALFVSPCVSPVVGALIGYVIQSGSWVVGAQLFFAFALGLGTILVVIGTLSGALKAMPRPGVWMVRVKQAFGVVMIALAIWLAKPVLFPAHSSSAPASSPEPVEGQTSIIWLSSLSEGIEQAKAQNKPVFIDFTAEWCAACKQMEREVFPKPEIIAESQRFVMVKFDATNPNAEQRAILKDYGVPGYPTIILIDTKGNRQSLMGFLDHEELLKNMTKIK